MVVLVGRWWVKRLASAKMEVGELINIEGQEDDESKYLTAKLVFDWRFHHADGFQLEEGEDSKALALKGVGKEGLDL